ncbi:holo-ACP synthase [Gordonia sp. TBRC 11910]|uniref:Holo-[acyl-carrier-protein] synthase n=1 Tax=Gordonia asplenii TaxID=2725283 RepID=A0A848L690_9ACTN|nr:holo-ACP synthase [Gordonia asplenii]NMO04515.1 holo-ACP synthase [Gordonia asplenii]
MSDLLSRALSDASVRGGEGSAQSAPRLGVDVVEIDVLARQLTSTVGDRFKRRIFTEQEIVDCRDLARKFATRWAIKEAVSKAIGTGFRQGLNPKAIEVLTAADGAIHIRPSHGQTWPHNAEGWKWSVSAAHEGNLAVAVAVAWLITDRRFATKE